MSWEGEGEVVEHGGDRLGRLQKGGLSEYFNHMLVEKKMVINHNTQKREVFNSDHIWERRENM